MASAGEQQRFWYVRSGGATLGPLSWGEVKESVLRRELGFEDELASKKEKVWRKLGEYSELKALGDSLQKPPGTPALPSVAELLRKRVRERTSNEWSGHKMPEPPPSENKRDESAPAAAASTAQKIPERPLHVEELLIRKYVEEPSALKTGTETRLSPATKSKTVFWKFLLFALAFGTICFFLGRWSAVMSSFSGSENAKKMRDLKDANPPDPSSPTTNASDDGDPIHFLKPPTPPKRN